MDQLSGIAELKQRIAAAEQELARLKILAATLETRAAAEMQPLNPPIIATPAPSVPPAPSAALPATAAAAAVELPPLLPPVLQASPRTPQPSRLREWLEPLQLWPPSGD